MAKGYWAGLDVGVETTSVCVINDDGEVLREATRRTDLREIHEELKWLRRRKSAHVGMEAGVGLALARGLRTLGYSVELYEARQLSKFLRSRRNKTDAGDAAGIAEAGRVGTPLVSKVFMKSLECQLLQSRLIIRRHLISQRVMTVNLLCRQIEYYGGRISGLKVGGQLRRKVEPELKRLFSGMPNSVAPELRLLLDRADELAAIQRGFDRKINEFVVGNELCQRWMEIPGVGPVCAATFFAAVCEPSRFRRSADIGPYFGLTPSLRQSGLTARYGRITKMGNRETRTALVRSAMSCMVWNKKQDRLKEWAAELEARRGRNKAKVALARKLAVIMIAMWKSGERFRSIELNSEVSQNNRPESDPEIAHAAQCVISFGDGSGRISTPCELPDPEPELSNAPERVISCGTGSGDVTGVAKQVRGPCSEESLAQEEGWRSGPPSPRDLAYS
jgi:transposase